MVAPGTPPGAYPITITATGSSGSQTLTANLNVQQGSAFTLSAGSPQTIQQGQPAAFTISLNPAAGSTGAVNLNVGPITGGVTASLSSTSVSAGSPVTLPLNAANNATLGAYSILVNGTSANGALTAHTVAPLLVTLGSNAGTTVQLGTVSVATTGQPTTITSPFPVGETINAGTCTAPAGLTVAISSALSNPALQTVILTASPGASSGNLNCTTSAGRALTAKLEEGTPEGVYLWVTPLGGSQYQLDISTSGFTEVDSITLGSGDVYVDPPSEGDVDQSMPLSISTGSCVHEVAWVWGFGGEDGGPAYATNTDDVCNEYEPPSTYTLSGQLTVAGTGNPLPGVGITIKDGNNNLVALLQTGNDGKYSTSVVPGGYDIAAGFAGPTLYSINSTPAYVTVNGPTRPRHVRLVDFGNEHSVHPVVFSNVQFSYDPVEQVVLGIVR